MPTFIKERERYVTVYCGVFLLMNTYVGEFLGGFKLSIELGSLFGNFGMLLALVSTNLSARVSGWKTYINSGFLKIRLASSN